MQIMNFKNHLTYNKIDVIITLASKSNEVTKICTEICVRISPFFYAKEKAGVRLPQRLFFAHFLVFIVTIT